MRSTLLISVVSLQLAVGICHVCHAGGITIIENGEAMAAIYADPAVMSEERRRGSDAVQREAEKDRVRLRESVKDLSVVLERISGAKIPIYTDPPPRRSETVAILVGKPAEERIGRPKKRNQFKQGWRLYVGRKGVGFIGESDEATSYAIYELLDQLGCRWYMPGELGEVLPSMKTITLKKRDVSAVPATIRRNIWCWQAPFRFRARLGGVIVQSVHGLEGYLCRKENIHLLEKNPEWNAEVDGERKVCGRICWASTGAANAIGDIIIKKLDENYQTSMTLTPADSVWFCQCNKCKALDTGDYDPAFGTNSITDRYINFVNKIAKRVHKKYPEMLFGTCAYEQYTRPPLREKPDPSMFISIAPILYCRAHSMLETSCPTAHSLLPIVQGWGKAVDTLIWRDYGYHLAEVTAPFPMIKKWSDQLPIVYEAGCKVWRPETMPTFEANLPGLALGVRMCHYPHLKPKDILDEFFTRFYGRAEKPMRDYWMTFDRAWSETPEHAGAIFSYAERFTPAVLKAARLAMDAALEACKTDMEKRRVTLANDSLTEFELYMKMYRDLLEGRLASLSSDLDRWLETWKALPAKYPRSFVFGGFGPKYVTRYLRAAYDEASKIARESGILTPKPLLTWRYMVDKEDQGKESGWFRADFDDKDWGTRDVSVDTWSDFGLWTYYGTVWNRTTVKLPEIPKGKKVYLWVSRTDGFATLYVNGKHIKYVAPDDGNPYCKKGEVMDAFQNYAIPGTFEITSAVKPGADNQVTIAGKRGRLFELGTGGLVGPVYIYCEK